MCNYGHKIGLTYVGGCCRRHRPRTKNNGSLPGCRYELFITAGGVKGKASWWEYRKHKYIKTIWDYKVINVAPRTNDHNCLMPNHPFQTQLYEQVLFSFMAFLLLRQNSVSGQRTQIQVPAAQPVGCHWPFLTICWTYSFFPSLHLKELDQENTSWRFFLLSHSQIVGTVLLLSGKLCLTHPNHN